jgi:dihydropteroate synthase
MGIVNLTPDSFSDGGRYLATDRAIDHARALAAAGADFLDLGAESTRPGAQPVSAAEELDRLLPVLEALGELKLPISVDTMKPQVMRAAIAAGASMINDVRALREPGALEMLSATHAAVCLMHMQGEPRSMQAAPHYVDVVGEVRAFLRDRVAACLHAGIPTERLVVDPGFGFGKTLAHNLTLLRDLALIAADGVPVLAGLSRKSALGQITGRAVHERLPGSLAAALMAVQRGARIIRVHDVAETKDVLAVWAALASVEPAAGPGDETGRRGAGAA